MAIGTIGNEPSLQVSQLAAAVIMDFYAAWRFVVGMVPLDYSTAMAISQQINRSRLKDLRTDLLMAASRYAELRVRSQRPEAAEDPQIGADRTRAYDAFIDPCNIPARNMRQIGEDVGWRDALGGTVRYHRRGAEGAEEILP